MKEENKDMLLRVLALVLGGIGLVLGSIRQERAIDKAVQKRLEQKDKEEKKEE